MFADSVAFPRKKVLEELTLLAKDGAAVGGDSIGVGAASSTTAVIVAVSNISLGGNEGKEPAMSVRACSATFAFSCSCAKATL